MKKILVLFALLLSIQVVAQKSAIQTAINYLRYEDLDKAKDAIDGASTNESTSGMAKTWFYKGSIYHAIYESKNEKFSGLKPGSLDEARKAYVKTMELDPKGEYKEDVLNRLSVLTGQLLNDGVDCFRDAKYAEAQEKFETSAGISEKYFGKTDTLAIYNAALAADKKGSSKEAIVYYKKLTEMNYGGAKTYSLLTKLYLIEKDTAAALQNLNSARQKFPEDKDLVTSQLNIYIMSGRTKEAFDQMDLAIKSDPENAQLHYIKGNLADQMGNLTVAEACYKQSLTLKPENADVNYSLGALYFNQGAEILNQSNKIPLSKTAEYDKAKKAYEAKFKESQPYFEKAYQINPKDMGTLQSLRQLYAQIGDLPKAEEMKKQIEVLKASSGK